MNFDLDTQHYNKDDYFDIFNLDKSMNATPESIDVKYEDLLNKLENGNLPTDEKNNIKKFLEKSKTNFLNILSSEKENYKLIEGDFTPDLNQSQTFRSNDHFIIKKNDTNEDQTSKINPFAKTTRSQLLNINTRFRKNYYDTTSTDFIIDLPEKFENVISMTVVSVQIPNSNYTFSSVLGSNEFSVELFDISKNDNSVVDGSQFKKNIKITNGIYTGNILEDYLNTYVFNDVSLNRIGCKYDEITRRFRFFRDYRPHSAMEDYHLMLVLIIVLI